MKAIEFMKYTDFKYKEPNNNIRNCPSCGHRLKYISQSKTRHVLTLIGLIMVISKTFECVNQKCKIKGLMADPDSIAYPGKKYGKDLLKEILILKYCLNLSTEMIIDEIHRRFSLDLTPSTVKRSITWIENILISNIRCYIEKALQDKKSIGIAIDYMEPKSKKHKVFCGFEMETKSILMFETLDGPQEAAIKHLMNTQANFCKDNIKVVYSDADTSLITYFDGNNNKIVNHLCSVHFLNLSYILAKDDNKLLMNEIKTFLQDIWSKFRIEEMNKIVNSSLEELPTELIEFNKLANETISIINNSKGKRNETYSCINACTKVEKFLDVLDKIDESKLDLPDLPIHKDSIRIKTFRKKILPKINVMKEFIHLIKDCSQIIKDSNLTKEKTLKSLDKIYKITNIEREYQNLSKKSIKKYQKKGEIHSYKWLFNQSKKKYLKYREKIANGKIFNFRDMTNNLCENSFSYFRRWFRKLLGSKNHSDREYLEYLPFFHLQCDLNDNWSLKYLFTFHYEHYNQIFNISQHNLNIYRRFHYPQKRLDNLLKSMEVLGGVSS